MQRAPMPDDTRALPACLPGAASSQIGPPEADNSTHARLMRQIRKTQMCDFWPHCRLGDQCTYAHGLSELRARPELWKTSLCKDWLMGKCPLGSAECNFAHSRHEKRGTAEFQTKSTKNQSCAEQQRLGDLLSAVGDETPQAPGSTSAPSTIPPWPSRPMSSEAWSTPEPGVIENPTSRFPLPAECSSSANEMDEFKEESSTMRRAPTPDDSQAPPACFPGAASSSVGPSEVDNSTHARLMRQIRKTQMCVFWPHCRLGGQCTYAHGPTELRARPELRKTSLCKDWQMGRCPLGSAECNFAHSRLEKRGTDEFKTKSAKKQSSAEQQWPDDLPSAFADETPQAPGSTSAPSTVPPWPNRLTPNHAWRTPDSGLKEDPTSRFPLPAECSTSASGMDEFKDKFNLLDRIRGYDTTKPDECDAGAAVEPPPHDVTQGGIRRHAPPTQSRYPCNSPRMALNAQSEMAARIETSQPAASSFLPGRPCVATQQLNETHAFPHRAEAVRSLQGPGPSPRRGSVADTLQLIGAALQLLAEGRDLDVLVTVRL